MHNLEIARKILMFEKNIRSNFLVKEKKKLVKGE